MVKGYKLGDPLVKGTSMGPIALPQTPAFLASVVSDASAKGAKVLVGGAPTTDETGRGRFFAPTVLADCTQDMAVMRDEAFGPIFAVTAVDSDAEAVQKINDSQFGLTAAVFTTNMKRFQTLGPQLSVGTVYMNRCANVPRGEQRVSHVHCVLRIVCSDCCCCGVGRRSCAPGATTWTRCCRGLVRATAARASASASMASAASRA